MFGFFIKNTKNKQTASQKANLAHSAELEMLINIFEDQNNDRSKLSEGQHCWN